jgi:hypothetical protein
MTSMVADEKVIEVQEHKKEVNGDNEAVWLKN